MNINWDARRYTDDFSFVHQYGISLLALIDVRAGARCLDLGCGNGALTQQLQQLGLSVTGMDASEAMLAIAREKHPNIPFVHGDAADFTLPHPVDVVFSNAVLHWVDASRHPAMLRCIYRALAGGGQFVFECGGQGNNARIHRVLGEVFARRSLPYACPFYFPTAQEYAALLREAGFEAVHTETFARPTTLAGENGLYDWMRMFIKAPFAGVPDAERDAMLREAVELARPELLQGGRWHADYVRLRGTARKPVQTPEKDVYS